jgi:hypothetical protein
LHIEQHFASNPHSNTPLLQLLADYEHQLKFGAVQWSLVSGARSLFQTYPQYAEKEFLNLLAAYFVEGGKIQHPEQQPIDWLCGGLADVSQERPGSIVYHVDEVLCFIVSVLL